MILLDFLYKGWGEERRARRAPRSTAKTKPGAEVGGQTVGPARDRRLEIREKARESARTVCAKRRRDNQGAPNPIPCDPGPDETADDFELTEEERVQN